MKIKTHQSLLLSGLLILPAVSSAAPLVTPDLTGTVAYEGWEGLTAANFPSYPGFPGSSAWPSPIDSNTAGSAGNASFNKESGDGYPATSGIYSASGGSFSMFNSSALAGLETVVVQFDLGEGFGYFTATPVLNYNSGSQNLAPVYVESGRGPTSFTNFETMETEYSTLFGYQWDLSGIGGITDFEIEWSVPAHVQTYNLRMDSGDDFSGNAISAVPEPESFAAFGGLFALCWVVSRRSRRS